jgi:predicted naringenin-chalcone synthase
LSKGALDSGDAGLFAICTTTALAAPGLTDLAVELGFSADVQRLAVGPMACSGAAAALTVCDAWVRVHRRPAVLLCVDVFSTHLPPPPYDMEAAVFTTIVADAAVAIVLRPQEHQVPGMEIVDSQALTASESAEEATLQVTDNGIYGNLRPTLPGIVGSNVAAPVQTLLERNGITADDVDWWAVHPGGRKIIEATAEALDLPQASTQTAFDVHRDHGNAGAATALLALERLSMTAPLRPGRHGLLVAYGPGITIWPILLRGSENSQNEEPR